MLVTNRGSTRLDTVGIALTSPKCILLAADCELPALDLNTVSEIDEYAGSGYTGGFGGASRQAPTLAVTENDTGDYSKISMSAVSFTGLASPGRIAPVWALVEEITNDAGSNVIAFIPLTSVGSKLTPTVATAASPAVITAAGHGLTAGELVFIEGFAGGTWDDNVNGKVFVVGTVTTDTFQLSGVDSTAFGTATFATAAVYTPIPMNGAPVTVTPDAVGLVRTSPQVGALPSS